LFFLQALKDLDLQEDVDPNLQLKGDYDSQKENLKGLKSQNIQSQKEISGLISSFSENFARFENDRAHLLGQLKGISAFQQFENDENHAPGMQAEDLRYARMLEYYERVGEILGKIGGIRIREFLENGVLLEATSQTGSCYGITLLFCPESCSLIGANINPTVPHDDLLQYTLDLGGDVQIFLSELMSRINTPK
jgi:hypothetical protein